MGKTCEQCGGTGQLVTGAEMRAKRLAAGLTLQAVADALGKTRQYIHALENGTSKHPLRWTADLTARYERALATAVATKAVRGGKQQHGEQQD